MSNSNSSKKFSITESVAEIVPTTTDDGVTWQLMFNGVDLCTIVSEDGKDGTDPKDRKDVVASLEGTEDLWIVVKNTKDWMFTVQSTWAYDDSGKPLSKMHSWPAFPDETNPEYRYICVSNVISRTNTVQDLSFKVYAKPTGTNKKGQEGNADPVFKIIVQRPAAPLSP